MKKYPRTPHLPQSPGVSNDDRIITTLDNLIGHPVIFTEKMDGENTTMTREYIHARSLDSKDHPSRHYVKGIWGNIAHLIPKEFRICGENCYAKHSIHYTNLDDYFLVFNIWDEDTCLSWEDTVNWCDLLGLKMVPVIGYCDYLSQEDIDYMAELVNTNPFKEGFVIRRYDSFNQKDFNTHVAKWVRKDHVQTDKHWMFQPIIKNNLK